MLYHDDFDDVPNKSNNSKFLPVYKFNPRDFFYPREINVAVILCVIVAIVVVINIVSSIFKHNDDEKAKALASKLHENTVQVEESVNEDVEESKQAEFVSVESNQTQMIGRAYLAPHTIDNIKARFLPRQLENPEETIKNLYFQEQKHVYLTFDDGPTATITPQILDILKAENVPATFFILGARAERNPDILKRAYDEGHYIANHGYSHSYSTIYASVETVWGEYAHAEQVIRNCIGNQSYNSYLFRFPGGSSGGKYSKVKAEAKEYFKSQRVATVNWNALSGDAEGANTKEEQLEYIERTSTDNTIILLMHDAADKQVTVDTLPDIIRFYRDRGYEFKNFYEIF